MPQGSKDDLAQDCALQLEGIASRIKFGEIYTDWTLKLSKAELQQFGQFLDHIGLSLT